MTHARTAAAAQQRRPAAASPLPARAAAQPPRLRSVCACGGRCPRCGAGAAPSRLQIVPADDPAEQRADRLAAALLGTQAPPAAARSRHAPAGAAPQLAEAALHGPGRALDAAQRAWFEPRLGRDLGAVRVHTGAEAAAAAQAVSAQAYTVGNDIVFGAGRYRPGSGSGLRLLAHELAHVVQPGAARQLRRSVVETPAQADEGEQWLPADPAPAGTAVLPAADTPETCPPPADMACQPASSTVAASDEFIFAVGSATLSPAQRRRLDAIAAAWHGSGGVFRIDGYASAEGGCSMNWGLSCQRAQAVHDALLAPSDGSPGVDASALPELFAHGESDAAGAALAANRRATISLPLPPQPDPEPDQEPDPDIDPGPQPVTPGCTLPVQLGTARGCGGGSDFTHFDFPSLSAYELAKFAVWASAFPGWRTDRWSITDAECQLDMAAALGGLARGAGLTAFSHFVSGGGATLVHAPGTTLGDDALASGSFQTTKDAVQRDIESQLATQATSGALDPCALSVTPPATHFGFGDSFALKAVIGGTQGETLTCTGFSGDAATRLYSIDLHFEICDDFGVDNSDLYGPGLFGFWVLQHERSASRYMPYINRLSLPVTLSGSF